MLPLSFWYLLCTVLFCTTFASPSRHEEEEASEETYLCPKLIAQLAGLYAIPSKVEALLRNGELDRNNGTNNDSGLGEMNVKCNYLFSSSSS